MDKPLTICDLFGCTLDDLVLGDVSASVNVGAAARAAQRRATMARLPEP